MSTVEVTKYFPSGKIDPVHFGVRVRDRHRLALLAPERRSTNTGWASRPLWTRVTLEPLGSSVTLQPLGVGITLEPLLIPRQRDLIRRARICRTDHVDRAAAVVHARVDHRGGCGGREGHRASSDQRESEPDDKRRPRENRFAQRNRNGCAQGIRGAGARSGRSHGRASAIGSTKLAYCPPVRCSLANSPSAAPNAARSALCPC
jgi:hypothetical protein